ncbi:hypothetical protein HN937_16960 [Candidatus Poribacteria bacterium]|jgi:hypothetical protein|nr:hypothetical protein [Candidatus Poribacteria bacterium]
MSSTTPSSTTPNTDAELTEHLRNFARTLIEYDMGEGVGRCTVGQMMSDNEWDLGVGDVVAEALLNGTARGGGGAAAEYTIRVVG